MKRLFGLQVFFIFNTTSHHWTLEPTNGQPGTLAETNVSSSNKTVIIFLPTEIVDDNNEL